MFLHKHTTTTEYLGNNKLRDLAYWLPLAMGTISRNLGQVYLSDMTLKM